MSIATTTVPQLFSGSLRPFPGIPEDWAESKRAIASSILADVQSAFPKMLGEVEPDADIEDFWEDAARISAAWRATDGNLVAKEPGTHSNPWTDDEMSRRLGTVARSEEGGYHGADKLIGHPIVQNHGGRGMLLGSLGGDPAADIITWLAKRHRDHGIKRGIVKTTATKTGIWSIELDSDPAVVAERLMDAMDWTYIRLEELPGAVFAQDELEVQYEYRIFVVDGEVISGAGCIEEFTPLDCRPRWVFDTRVRRVRGHLNQGEPSPVEYDPVLVGRLLKFGQGVAKEHGGTVVIDVALDAVADEPVVIELNNISNSGLYASDPWLVAEKLVSAKDRGYLI
jgi:hypothetical protein